MSNKKNVRVHKPCRQIGTAGTSSKQRCCFMETDIDTEKGVTARVEVGGSG